MGLGGGLDDGVPGPAALLFCGFCACGAILGRVKVPIIPKVESVPAVGQLCDGLVGARVRVTPTLTKYAYPNPNQVCLPYP